MLASGRANIAPAATERLVMSPQSAPRRLPIRSAGVAGHPAIRHSDSTMALRLGGLADLDPAAVPLPPGTEVVTRVARMIHGELRPGGATGRVVTSAARPGDPIEVVFID